MSLLAINNLSVYFKEGKGLLKAVNAVSFSVEENEIVGLVGESGSGKTITGYSIMGILPREAEIKSGIIEFEGKNILGLKDKDMLDLRGSKIGIVFQEPFTSLNPVLRVGYQIEEMLLFHKRISKIEAKNEAMQLLKKVRIENPERIFYDYPHQLSGGQRQRIMIAIAIALNPKLLIADEPTTALDVTIQSEILKLLRDLKNELGLTILFITHDFGIINEMADRIIVMKEGEIVEMGKKQDILNTPKHEYTKRLIDAVPKIGQPIDSIDRAQGVFIGTKNLSKSFPIERGALKREVSRVQAVRDVNIEIKRGNITGLVGESGCGKTTLGKLLVGIENPDSGEILSNTSSKRYQIIFQDPYSSLDPRMRMGDVVLEGVNIFGAKKYEKDNILKDILNKVQLSYEDRFKFPHQFSGGQRQRIAIARALAVKPEFLVLDEPISSLDVIIQKEILNLLKELKEKMNLTYLFISHDLRVVEYFSDYVYVMYNGQIVEGAPKEDIYKIPKHPYTRRLLDSIPQSI